MNKTTEQKRKDAWRDTQSQFSAYTSQALRTALDHASTHVADIRKREGGRLEDERLQEVIKSHLENMDASLALEDAYCYVYGWRRLSGPSEDADDVDDYILERISNHYALKDYVLQTAHLIALA